MSEADLACPEGLEPPTYGLEGRCSIQLSYGQMVERPTERAFVDSMVGAIGFEPTTLWSQTRCATRLRYAPTSLAFYPVAGPKPERLLPLCRLTPEGFVRHGPVHTPLATTDQRQGRALCSISAEGVGLRLHLPELSTSHRRLGLLESSLQLAPPAPSVRGCHSHVQAQATRNNLFNAGGYDLRLARQRFGSVYLLWPSRGRGESPCLHVMH